MGKNDQKNAKPELDSEKKTDLVEDIGSVAGRVYAELSRAKDPKELEELKRLVNSNEVHYHMAIGWLARENKLSIDKINGMTMVKLK